MLYCASADVPAASTDISVNGNELTVNFNRPVAHAYTNTANPGKLAQKFIVSDDTTLLSVRGAAVTDEKLVLTLSKTFAYGDNTNNVKLAYKDLETTDSDGIGFPATRVVMKSLHGGGEMTGATNDTPQQNTGPGPGGDDSDGGTPSDPDDTLDDAESNFNEENPDAGVKVTFPDAPIANPDEVAIQLGGQKPVIVTDATVKSVALTPSDGSSQAGAQGLGGLGAGWGAKIEVQLSVTPRQGEILLLPVALAFSLTQNDLAEVGLTAEQVAADVSALLAQALFAKFPAEGPNQGTLQDLTDLLTGIVTVTADAEGGVSIGLPFLLANGAGEPRAITDNGRKRLVIFDGESNGWLRDPVYLYRRQIVPTALSLTPEALTIKVGQTGTFTAILTPEDATERGLIWTIAEPLASLSYSGTGCMLMGLAEGTATLTVAASEDRSVTATANVTVIPADEGEEEEEEEYGGSSGGGCDAGLGLYGAALALGGAFALRRPKKRG